MVSPSVHRRRARPGRWVYASLGIVCALAVAASVASAQDQDEADRGEISSLRSERVELARSAADSASRIDALRADDEAVASALADLESYIELQRSRVAAAVASITAAQAEAAAANQEAEWLQADIDAIREQLRQRVIDVFVEPRNDTVNQLADNDFVGSSVKLYLLDQVLGSEVEIADDLRTAQGQLEVARRLALERAAAAEEERLSQAQRLAELEEAEDEAQRLRDEIQARIDEWERVSEEIAGADRDIQNEIAAIEREIQRREELRRRAEEEARRRAVEEQRRAAEAADGPFQLVAWPADGVLTSPFGPRVHPIFGVRRMHNGIDIGGSTGDPVRAARSGEVIVAGWREGFGNTIVLYHGLGYSTLYAHMSRIGVSVGEEVASGDRIGSVGSTGWSTGPHLHFEFRIDGEAVDPMPYMP